jgi:hypothetical protein
VTRTAASFRQADLTRAARAMTKAGLTVRGARISPSGEIEVLTAGAPDTQLVDHFGEWKAKRDARHAQGN